MKIVGIILVVIEVLGLITGFADGSIIEMFSYGLLGLIEFFGYCLPGIIGLILIKKSSKKRR